MDTATDLKSLRINAGLTAQSVALILGITQQSVNVFESGRNSPRTDTLARYYAAVGRFDLAEQLRPALAEETWAGVLAVRSQYEQLADAFRKTVQRTTRAGRPDGRQITPIADTGPEEAGAVERVTRTTTRTEDENGHTMTRTRTDASYTLTKVNWVRTKHVDGAVSYDGSRAGWVFHIHMPRDGKAKLTGSHEDGRTVKSAHLTTTAAKEAAIFSMRPDEAMAWVDDRRYYPGVLFKVARWDRFRFAYYGTQLRVEDGTDVTYAAVSSFTDAREVAKQALRGAYGGPLTPIRTDGSTEVSEALTAALTAAGVKVTGKQFTTMARLLAADLLPDTN